MTRCWLAAMVCCFITFNSNAAESTWVPDPSSKTQVKVAKTIEQFQQQSPDIQKFFSEAYGYAVFPTAGRFGSALGGAYGSGLLFENDQLVATTNFYQFIYGIFFGGQVYSQIIFFKEKEAMDIYKSGALEFSGRASVAFITFGASADPSYYKDIAIFSLTKGGLLLEVAPGAIKFSHKPIDDSKERTLVSFN